MAVVSGAGSRKRVEPALRRRLPMRRSTWRWLTPQARSGPASNHRRRSEPTADDALLAAPAAGPPPAGAWRTIAYATASRSDHDSAADGVMARHGTPAATSRPMTSGAASAPTPNARHGAGSWPATAPSLYFCASRTSPFAPPSMQPRPCGRPGRRRNVTKISQDGAASPRPPRRSHAPAPRHRVTRRRPRRGSVHRAAAEREPVAT